MKRAILVAQAHQVPWAKAFEAGLKKHGFVTQVTRNPARCDLLVLWGVRRTAAINAQKLIGGEVCILERGYLGDRFKWTSVSFGGGLNGKGIFRGPFHDGSRWETHFSHLMRPWKGLSGGYALILGQVPQDMSVKGINLQGFYAKAAKAFGDVGFIVKFRPHPKVPRDRSSGVSRLGGELSAALDGAAVTISHNSNSSVEAVLAGVPSVTMDRGSMAWDVTGHELKFPEMPDRTNWAWALAWKQWQLEEMQSGFCWDAIRELKGCEQAA